MEPPTPGRVRTLTPVNEVAVSVVVPAYNEELAIGGTLRSLLAWMEDAGLSHEILVVDNASTDATRDRVGELADGDRVRLLANDVNRGKGYSVRRGILESRGALVLHCDADCAPSLPSLRAMMDLSRRYDLVVGSRLAAGSRVGRRQPLRRRIAGRGFQQLCRLILSEPVTDLFCGFKLWHGPDAREVYERVTLDGWLYDAEAIAVARALGHTVTEYGIDWADREGSRLSMSTVLVPAVRDLLKARAQARRVAREPRPARPAAEPALSQVADGPELDESR